METFSWLVISSVGDPWCLVQYWVATNEGTFDILGNFGVTPTVGTGGRRRSKKVATVEPKPALGRWCHLAHGQLTPSKMLLSEISPKLEPLKLSLEICPISTSARSPNCQRKLFIQHNQREEKHSFDPGSWRNRPTYADDPDRLQLWIVVSHQSLCNRPAQRPLKRPQ